MGTRISVKKTQRGSVKFVNINIKPSAADVGEVEGMFDQALLQLLFDTLNTFVLFSVITAI